jgi:hypothetical protein
VKRTEEDGLRQKKMETMILKAVRTKKAGEDEV